MFKLALVLSSLFAYSVFAKAPTPAEHDVQLIKLAAPLDNADIEISGMAWCGDTLMLLPQYPERYSPKNESFLYQLPKQQILNYLESNNKTPLKATPIRLFENDIRTRMSFFDGFEAIACNNNAVWLSIEAQNLFGTYQAYIVPAELDQKSESPNISIRTDQIRYVKSQSGMNNKGDEAIVLHGEHLISLHEVNDKRQVPFPKGNRVHLVTGKQSQVNFANLPYRITDASASDAQGRFWVINYKYSRDRFSREANDTLAEQYGLGASHKKYRNAERLVQYKFVDNAIVRTDRAPIQLKMHTKQGRNWEGLVRLDDRGFLIATDKHPNTLLGFVSFTANETVPTARRASR